MSGNLFQPSGYNGDSGAVTNVAASINFSMDLIPSGPGAALYLVNIGTIDCQVFVSWGVGVTAAYPFGLPLPANSTFVLLLPLRPDDQSNLAVNFIGSAATGSTLYALPGTVNP